MMGKQNSYVFCFNILCSFSLSHLRTWYPLHVKFPQSKYYWLFLNLTHWQTPHLQTYSDFAILFCHFNTFPSSRPPQLYCPESLKWPVWLGSLSISLSSLVYTVGSPVMLVTLCSDLPDASALAAEVNHRSLASLLRSAFHWGHPGLLGFFHIAITGSDPGPLLLLSPMLLQYIYWGLSITEFISLLIWSHLINKTVSWDIR